MILGAEHTIKQFFPPGTAEKLFEKYPSQAQSASQWDKTFQEYVDEIWEDICAENERYSDAPSPSTSPLDLTLKQ